MVGLIFPFLKVGGGVSTRLKPKKSLKTIYFTDPPPTPEYDTEEKLSESNIKQETDKMANL